MMEGAYGGGKAGGAFDPITFVQRPQVILRAVCWLFSIVIFGCIASQGWQTDPLTKKEECLFNKNGSACNFGVGIAVIAFLASMGFIAGEFLFEQMPSIKTRKHYVMGDLGFSAFWAFLFFVSFCFLTNQWGNTGKIAGGVGVNNMQAAIAFSFFSIFTWAGHAYLSFLRYKVGAEQAFAGYEADPNAVNPAGYNSYPDATDPDGGYSQQPFNNAQDPSGLQQQQQQQQQQAPQY